jgi:hypothetical protein
MLDFTALERAVLAEICRDAEEPALLERQLASASVTRRENTGDGFFTWFAVDRTCAAFMSRWRVLGNVHAAVEGFERPITLTLFRDKDGYANLLEATSAAQTTVGLDFFTVRFTINPPY